MLRLHFLFIFRRILSNVFLVGFSFLFISSDTVFGANTRPMKLVELVIAGDRYANSDYNPCSKTISSNKSAPSSKISAQM